MCPETYGAHESQNHRQNDPSILMWLLGVHRKPKTCTFLVEFFSTDTNCIRVRCSVRVCGKNSIRKVHVLGFPSLSISIEDFFDRGFGF